MERKRFIEYADDVELVFVELPKFDKELESLANIKDKWIYFLKRAGDLDYIPETLSDPCIALAFETINEAALAPEELELQEKRHDFIRLQRGALVLAKEQGIEQGALQEKEAIARKMIKAGISKQDVILITGLNMKQLKQL